MIDHQVACLVDPYGYVCVMARAGSRHRWCMRLKPDTVCERHHVLLVPGKVMRLNELC